MEQNFWITSYKTGTFLTDWSITTSVAIALDYKVFAEFVTYLVNTVENIVEQSTLASFWKYLEAYQAYYLMANTKHFVNPTLMWSHGKGALDKLWNALANGEAKKYVKRVKAKFPLKVVDNVYTTVFLEIGRAHV